VWFDTVESVRWPAPACLTLLRDMADAQREPHNALKADVALPAHFAGASEDIHNRSRWGRRCSSNAGFAMAPTDVRGVPVRRGAIRRLGAADRAVLLARDAGLACLNCGAAIGAHDERCTYCDSLPGLVDIARLARSARPGRRHRSSRGPRHRAGARIAALHRLRGSAADGCDGELLRLRRDAGGRPAAPSGRGVGTLEAGLRAHARTPTLHVKARRLAEPSKATLPRRPRWARQMEAETAAAHPAAADRDFFADLRERPWTVAVAAALALLCWTIWR
jgi:hypothetical protein